MKKICLFIICLFVCIPVFAEPIPFEKAHMIARNWAISLKTCYNDDVTVLAGESIVREGITVAHVFHFSPRGYVMVSAEDYLPPIKVYSLKNNFGEEGKPLEEFIFNQNLEIIEKAKSGVLDPQKYFMERNRNDFKLLTREFPPLKRVISPVVGVQEAEEVQEVQPLLSTTWYQKEPYNLKCPVLDDRRCVTGCVATGFAQIMKYHAYPDRGQGSWSYQTYTHNIPVSTSFDHPYYWDLMLDNYPTPDSGTEEQREAIAQLMFDVGVSLNMDYSPDGSGANTSQSVITFPIFFKYPRDIIYVRKHSRDDTEWFDLAKNHVDRGFPVAFVIYDVEVGHLVVIDGYRISTGSRTFHINMGWGGSWDGYYSLDNIIVRDGKYHFTVLERQAYTLNITHPDSVTELPPLDFGAFAHVNKSLFFKQYFCEIKWKGFPPQAQDIDRYDIVKFDINTLERSDFAQVDHTGQAELYQYTFRIPEPMPDIYYVYAVNHEGERELLMCCNLVVKE
ncbi:MAG: hypothetical protein GTO45_13285 [Candidatus Aminicenantes bacterium]|nr:hypothetical protein [Candidatus Aminicenantes bacterium]NIM79748.1 hypothetical protein [Candidatus Aminicenantes bacterium]NIN19079.1 hypothetical protein [Candidatus Aminicenantes bacterium]NIN42981.1 hypothetical protein [Candidatus Aminicenantes bacterium]NIN85724.1 hypothetical protein [Candidatus Aminicenantes bacterium]